MTPAEWVLVAFGVLVAFAVGSFTCVVIDRLPLALDEPNEYGDSWDTRPWREVLGGSSRCSSCGADVRWSDNVPVLGWLRLRGRCRECGEPIPAFHPIVELAVPAGAVLMALAVGWEWRLLPALVLVPVALAIAAIDLRTLIVPTKLVWPTLFVTAALSALVVVLDDRGEWRWLLGALLSLVAFSGPLFVLWWIHPKGMGFGDVRLTAMLGWNVGFAAMAEGGSLWSGPYLVLLTVTLAAILGIVLGVALVRGLGRHVPFGPSLAVSSLVTIALAQQILIT